MKVNKVKSRFKYMQMFMGVSIALVMLLILPVTSFAKVDLGIEPGALTSKPTEGTASMYKHYGESALDLSLKLQNNNYLDKISNDIRNNENKSVTMSGSTFALQKVSKVGVTLYLERWDGSEWITVTRGEPFSETNSYSVSGSQSITVEKGYYYRTKSIHIVENDSKTESETIYSSYILISK